MKKKVILIMIGFCLFYAGYYAYLGEYKLMLSNFTQSILWFLIYRLNKTLDMYERMIDEIFDKINGQLNETDNSNRQATP